VSIPADLLYLAAIILIAWLTGCVLLAALMLSPRTRGRIQGLWPLMLSEAGILLAGTLPWLLPQAILGLALAAAAVRIGYESSAVNGGPAQPEAGSIGACLLVGIAVMAWFLDREAWTIGLVLLVMLITGITITTLRHPPLMWLWRFLVFPALPFALFVFAARRFDVAFIFVLSLLIVEIFDSFSLLGGRLIGKRLLVPKLSPKKTWEGLAVGLLAVGFSAFALAAILDKELPVVVVIAIAATAGAIAGDLMASAAKRRAGVKDYPTILPVQGGLLDIMDAWIVAGPLAAFTAILLQ
jgi:phosphatidate cytidylyltransferase